jgi:hypothetical protein
MDLLSKFHNKYDFRLFYAFVELFLSFQSLEGFDSSRSGGARRGDGHFADKKWRTKVSLSLQKLFSVSTKKYVISLFLFSTMACDFGPSVNKEK